MNTTTVLLTAQIIISLFLIGCVLLQSQGSGLGSAWGGGGESYHTKRGVERVLFGLTIFFIVCFAFVSILTIVLV